MSIESTSTIEGLVATNPTPQDPIYQGPNHIWLIKSVLKNIFPGLSGNGFSKPITATEDELNRVKGVTSPLQAQINALQAQIDAIGSGGGGGTAIPEQWPIGSIFHCTLPTNPATLLGFGTWSRFGQGRMLVSQISSDADFAAAGFTGGSKVSSLLAHSHSASSNVVSTGHNHALGIVADHTHGASSGNMSANATHSHTGSSGNMSANANHSHSGSTGTMSANASHSHTGSTGAMSANASHSHTTTVTAMMPLAGQTDSKAWHNHTGTTDWGGDHQHHTNAIIASAATGGGSAVLKSGVDGISTSSAGSHQHTFSTEWTNLDHTHTVSNASANTDHTHSITTNAASIDHSHSVTVSSSSVEHSHTITVGNASVEHTHVVTVNAGGGHTHTIAADAGSHSHTITVDSTGVAAPNNMPPYVVVYMWQRVA